MAAGDMSADAAADTVAAEVAGREALQALRSIDPAQLDVSLPDGLALQVHPCFDLLLFSSVH